MLVAIIILSAGLLLLLAIGILIVYDWVHELAKWKRPKEIPDPEPQYGFSICASYPLHDNAECIEQNDELLLAVAKQRANWSGSGACAHGGDSIAAINARRELGFVVPTLKKAVRLRVRLEQSGIAGLIVTIREQ